MSSLKELYKSAETSWLTKKIDKKLIRHYLNLVHIKEDVIELHGMPKSQLQTCFTALKKDIIATQGIPIDQVVASFAELERWSNDCRASFISSASSGSSLSAHSIFSQSTRPTSLASLVTQYSDDARCHGPASKRYHGLGKVPCSFPTQMGISPAVSSTGTTKT